MKIVFTHGVFDLLHFGHMRYLKKAKSYGDKLIVCLDTNDYVKKQNRYVYYDYNIRKEMLESLKYVDLVIPHDRPITEEIIKKYQVDILISTKDGRNYFDHLKNICEVIYLNRTEEISTTKIKEDLGKRSSKC